MKYRHNRKRRMIRVGFLVLSIIFIAGVVLFTIKGITKKEVVKSPEQVLKSYMNCICQKNYSEMYEMITNESKETIEKIWCHYFDLDRDYGEIKSFLLKEDEKLQCVCLWC